MTDEFTRRGQEIDRLRAELAAANAARSSAVALQRADYLEHQKQAQSAARRELDAETALFVLLSQTQAIPHAKHSADCWRVHAECLADLVRRQGGPTYAIRWLREQDGGVS